MFRNTICIFISYLRRYPYLDCNTKVICKTHFAKTLFILLLLPCMHASLWILTCMGNIHVNILDWAHYKNHYVLRGPRRRTFRKRWTGRPGYLERRDAWNPKLKVRQRGRMKFQDTHVRLTLTGPLPHPTRHCQKVKTFPPPEESGLRRRPLFPRLQDNTKMLLQSPWLQYNRRYRIRRT